MDTGVDAGLLRLAGELLLTERTSAFCTTRFFSFAPILFFIFTEFEAYND